MKTYFSLCIPACVAIAMLSAGISSADGAVIRVVCLNDTTDSARINNAITGSAWGDEIVIDGPALITQTISLLGGRTYRGEVRTPSLTNFPPTVTTLKQEAGANLVAILASASYMNNSANVGEPLTIRQLTVDGNRDNNTGNTIGILLRNKDTVVEDVIVQNMDGDAMLLSNPSRNSTPLGANQNMSNGRVSNCFFQNNSAHGFNNADAGGRSLNWQIIDNWIAEGGSDHDSILVEDGNGWVIDRNHIYGVRRHAIYVYRAYGASISNNYIEGFGETTTPGTYYGIGVELNDGASLTNINENRIFNFGGENSAPSNYYYICIVKVNSGAGNARVAGNLIRGESTTNPRWGLQYSRGNFSLTVRYKGNSVENVQTPRSWEAGVTMISENCGL